MGMASNFQNNLESLLDAKTEELEKEALKLISIYIRSLQESKNHSFSHSELNQQLSDGGNTVNRFLSYIFYRKYGKSEVGQLNGKSSKDHFGKDSAFVSETIDGLIAWITSCCLSHGLLGAFSFAITQAHDKPVVRHKTVNHLMDWLEHCLHEFNNDLFSKVVDTILLGLTDIWSAVRKSCASKLHSVIEHFTVDQLGAFLSKIVELHQSCDGRWQTQEGIVLGINVVVRSLHWTSIQSNTNQDDTEYVLLFGHEELVSMPDVIVQCMEGPIFTMLAHPQLSVREIAVKAYTAYIVRCDFNVALSSFQTVVTKLHNGCSLLQTALIQGQVEVTPSSLDGSVKGNVYFLDAYEAEGLLCVCVHLVKHISACHLLPWWDFYSSTFLAYLTHPASTVRQTSSSIFKFLVAKESSNPGILRLVLQVLCSDWMPDVAFLTEGISIGDNITKAEKKTQAVLRGIQERPGGHRWGHGGQGKRICATKLKKFASAAEQSEAWQWREGRLLAYELLLQFLIKNHLLYSFGSAQFNQSAPSRERTIDSSSTDRSAAAKLGQSFDHFSSSKEKHSSPNGDESSQSAMRRQSLVYKVTAALHSNEFVNPGSYCDSPRNTHRHFSYLTNHPKTSPSQANQPCSLLNCIQTTEQQSSSKQEVGALLEKILLQSIESMADVRWELRRMGQQLLPCIVEVIRWFDLSILERLWEGALVSSPITSIMTYSACLTFLFSLQHNAKFFSVLTPSHPSALDDAMNGDAVSLMNCSTEMRVGWVAEAAIELLRRPEFDKLSITAMHVILVAHTNYASKLTPIAEEQLGCVTASWLDVFIASHAGQEVVSKPPFSLTSAQPFLTPTEGFLCCCLHPDQGIASLSQQFEKSLVTELAPGLSEFLRVCPEKCTSVFLPILAVYVTQYSSIDTTAKHILDSLSVAVERCQKYLLSTQNSSDEDDLSNCRTALFQLNFAFTSKSLDLQTFRTLTELYLQLCQCFHAADYLPSLLSVLSGKLKEAVDQIPPPPVVAPDSSDFCNHVTVFNTGTGSEDSTDDDTDGTSLMESGKLNTSGGSGTLYGISPHSNPLSPRGPIVNPLKRASCDVEAAEAEEDSAAESDWDDWSDEEAEENRGLSSLLAEFYTRLRHQITSNPETQPQFERMLLRLPDKERNILSRLS